jgi:alanyl-tRNA synthetase
MTTTPELKIIADHLRSSCFLIADGVLPSNEGRGYVLRRIMRRGMRQLHKLGAREASMFKLVDALIKEMGAAYPELARARAVIIETLKIEEEKFRETLEKGLKILDESLDVMLSSACPEPVEGSKHDSSPNSESCFDPSTGSGQAELSMTSRKNETTKFSGAIAFKLYDTYGFPLDLTQDILKEKNIEVDVEGFNVEMEKQRNRGKENWSGSGEVGEEKIFFELKEKFGETKFLGYENLSAKAKILAVISGGIILDQTPFYATSGGQKGDDGKIGNVEIFETKKFAGNLFVHFFVGENCELKVGDEVSAEVNPKTRAMRAANHSATHLMHKALKEILGNSISQKGSNVDAEYFTFDFNFNRAMSVEEILRVEDLVNSYIQKNSAVKTELMPIEKARDTGAEALFGEKYDTEVRVVSMSPSVELCGGTHVAATGNIGIFKLISENGIAAGIRRITAKTGFAAIEHQRQKEKDAQEKSENLQQELKKKDKEIERLKKQILFAGLGNLKSEKIGAVNLLTHIFEDADAKELREILLEIKNKKDFSAAHIFAFFGCKDGKVSVVVALTNDLQEKFDSTKLIVPIIEAVGGKGGGGKKDLAMGGGVDVGGIAGAIEILKLRITN